jgi:hypothetical protein
VKPAKHEHTIDNPLAMHMPLFWQGFGVHGLLAFVANIEMIFVHIMVLDGIIMFLTCFATATRETVRADTHEAAKAIRLTNTSISAWIR